MLVMDTVVCLTLAKWETVSGQFGGYLTRIEPDKPDHNKRTFECPNSENVESFVVKYK